MTGKNFFEDVTKALSGPRLGFLAFVAAGGYLLWTEHQAHLTAALPYLVLLLCPLMHVFMHRGHGGHQGGNGHHHENHR